MASEIPGPRPWPLVGNLPNIDLANSIQSIVDIGHEYGPIFKLRLAGEDKLFVTGHELVKELCSRKDFVKFPSGAVEKLRAVMPQGQFTAFHNEWFWGPAHRVLVPAFGPISVKNMFPEMHDIATQMMLRWARFGEHTPLDVCDEFTRLTIDTIALCTMDTRINSFYKDNRHPFIDSMIAVLVEAAKRSERPDWLNWCYWNANKQFDKENEFIHQFAKEVLDSRRNKKHSKKDLLDAMMNGKDPSTGKGLPDQTIVDNLITFLMAGHETTACLLGFSFALLLKHPEAYAKVQSEVDTVIGDAPLVADDISRLPYIKACLKEALRMYPPSAGFSLTPHGDEATHGPVLLGGKWPVKPRQATFVLIPNLHHDQSAWGPNVNEFKPERMLDENFKKLPPGCYKPFGNGLRACIGSEFAMQEAILATALLFQKFDFRLVDPDYKITIKQTLTLKPGNLYMYAKLRPGKDAVTLPTELVRTSKETSAPSDTPNSFQATDSGKTPEGMMPISIFVGSNTGTCQGLAEILAMTALQRKFQAEIQSLDQAVNNLPKDRPVLILTSTMYEGQAPDNGAKFVEWLEHNDNTSLAGVQYAVFGCGSSDWKDTFQRAAIHIDERLQEKGATSMALRGAADVAEGNILADFDAWQADHFWPGLASVYSTPSIETTTMSLVDLSQFPTDVEKPSARVVEAKIMVVKALTDASEDRPKFHLKAHLPEGTQYSVGDYLEVYPKNNSADYKTLVDILAARGYDLNDPLVSAIFSRLEMHQQASSRHFDVLVDCCEDAKERTALSTMVQALSSSERRPSIVQLLRKFPSVRLSLEKLAIMLPPIRPRQYSISSSPLASPTTLTLTWSAITHAAPSGLAGEAPTRGMASHFLANLKAGDSLRCSVRPGPQRFCPPTDVTTTPLIMVCAGAGLAPFRGFVQDRVEQLRRNPTLTGKVAPALLYVGCRLPEHRLYGEELQRWQSEGAVEVRYAYSRCDERLNESEGMKGYVQDCLWRDQDELAKLWDEGAKVCVCGSRNVSHGVREVVKKIYKEQAETRCGSKTDDEVEAWWVRILRDRYVAEVF